MQSDSVRLDHRIISDLIAPGSSVLDLGCGYGDLLYLLIVEKNVHAQGIEIDEQAIYSCVAKGLNVFHGDIDTGLSEYPDDSFDYVILNQTLQQVEHLQVVLWNAMRVGKRVVVGIPNFAHYKARLQVFFRGKTPVTSSLPYRWYDTPNLHFLSVLDFFDYCREKKITIEKTCFIGETKRIRFLPNLFADAGIFVISNKKPDEGSFPGIREADPGD